MDLETPSTPVDGSPERDDALAAAALEASDALLMVVDRAGRIARFNRACERATGERSEEVRGRSFFSLLDPGDEPRFRDTFAQLVAQGARGDEECGWLGRGETRRLVCWRFAPIFGAGGGVAFVACTGFDVTGQRRELDEREQRREEQQRRAEQLAADLSQLQVGVDSMEQALMVFDHEGRVVSANRAARELLGALSDGTLEGLSDHERNFEVADAQGRAVEFEAWPLARALRGETVRSVELRMRRRSGGDWIAVLFSAQPAFDEQGRVTLCILTIQDVTALKRTEEELRRSEEWLRTLADNSPDLIARFDRSLRHIFVNRALCRQMGATAEQILGRTLSETTGPMALSFAPYEDALRRTLENAQRGRLDLVIHGPRGPLYLDLMLVPELGPDGRVETILAIGRDVTELRRALEGTRSSAAELKAALDAVPAMVFITRDADARQMEGNRFAYEALGVEPGANLSKTPEPGSEAPAYQVAREGHELVGDELPVQRAAATGAEVRDAEIDMTFADGGSHRMLGNVAPLLGPQGEPQGAIGVFVDISERRQAEQERERLLVEVRQLADRIARLQGATQAFSAAATSEKISRVLLDEVARSVPSVHRALLVVESPDTPDELQLVATIGDWEKQAQQLWYQQRLDRLNPALRAQLKKLQPIFIESRQQLLAAFPMLAALPIAAGIESLLLLPLATEGRKVGVAGFSYSTSRQFPKADRDFLATLGRLGAQALERARLYESEQRHRAAAEQEARLRERLMVVLGHDLRQPMSVVSSSVGGVLHRAEGLPSRVLPPLRRSLRAVGNMDSLIGTLLDYSRLRAGHGLELEVVSGDLGEWSQALLSALQVEHLDHTLEFERSGDLHGEWDRERVGRVLGNLVSNAMAFGDPAAPVKVRLQDRGGLVELEVANQGAPIPPERQAEIFEPFGRARGENASSRGGLGLGLFIAREIARAHGGEIAVRSSAEEGTVFTVTLLRRPAGRA